MANQKLWDWQHRITLVIIKEMCPSVFSVLGKRQTVRQCLIFGALTSSIDLASLSMLLCSFHIFSFLWPCPKSLGAGGSLAPGAQPQSSGSLCQEPQVKLDQITKAIHHLAMDVGRVEFLLAERASSRSRSNGWLKWVKYIYLLQYIQELLACVLQGSQCNGSPASYMAHLCVVWDYFQARLPFNFRSMILIQRTCCSGQSKVASRTWWIQTRHGGRALCQLRSARGGRGGCLFAL